MPRRIDLLTLGLSASSRWNPLYRWWARRNVTQNMATLLKALQLRLGEDDLLFGPHELAVASSEGAVLEPLPDGSLRLRLTGRTPSGVRILWGRRATPEADA